MSGVNVHDYCQNPAKYIGVINPLIQKYYDSQCASGNNLVTITFQTSHFYLPSPTGVLKKTKGTVGAKSVPLGDIIDDISLSNFLDLIERLINVIASPDFWTTISEFEGGKLGIQGTISILTNLLQKGFSEGLIEGMSELAEKGFAESMINASLLLTGMLREGLEFGVSRFAATFLLKSLSLAFEFIENPIISMLMLLFQIVGMIFSMYDPCGLSNYLDHEAMTDLTQKYNDAFREALLTDLLNGNQQEVWPINIPFNEYFNYYLSPEETAAQNLEFGKGMLLYLANQHKDSNGNLIVWPSGGEVLDNSILQRYASKLDSTFLRLSNNNRVVANWLDRHYYWIIAVVFVLLIIFILFVFVK